MPSETWYNPFNDDLSINENLLPKPSLSPEEEKKLKPYEEKWNRIITDTKFDEELAKEAINRLYSANELDSPKILIADSPLSTQYMYCVHQCALLYNEKNPSKLIEYADNKMKDPVEWFNNSSTYSTLCAYDYYLNETNLIEDPGYLRELIDVAMHCHWFLVSEGFCYLSRKPIRLMIDELNNAHSLSGPAISYADGFSVHCINGVSVDSDIVMTPHLITKERIEKEKNKELKQILIQQYKSNKLNELKIPK
jgi:hypothetical protein